MDKVTRYRSIAKEILNNIADDRRPSRKEIFYYVVEDDKKGHYLLFSDGWTDINSRYYGCSVHLEVRDTGKVYVNFEMTDYEVINILMEKGVAKKDIVPAFNPPEVREEMGYAAT